MASFLANVSISAVLNCSEIPLSFLVNTEGTALAQSDVFEFSEVCLLLAGYIRLSESGHEIFVAAISQSSPLYRRAPLVRLRPTIRWLSHAHFVTVLSCGIREQCETAYPIRPRSEITVPGFSHYRMRLTFKPKEVCRTERQNVMRARWGDCVQRPTVAMCPPKPFLSQTIGITTRIYIIVPHSFPTILCLTCLWPAM
jgi:hypothetical protein